MKLANTFVLLLLVVGLAESGSLVKRDTSTSFDKLWAHLSNFMTETLHLIGSMVPLRGLATMAKDMGVPFAAHALTALTPKTNSFPNPNRSSQEHGQQRSQRRSDTISHDDLNQGHYQSMREEMSAAVGALMGKEDCIKKLACLSGRHLSHVKGASSMALLVTSAQSYLPESFHSHLNTLHSSIMYSEDCDQYKC